MGWTIFLTPVTATILFIIGYILWGKRAAKARSAELWAEKETTLLWQTANIASQIKNKIERLTSPWVQSDQDKIEAKREEAIEQIIKLINLMNESALILDEDIQLLLEQMFQLLDKWIRDAEQYIRAQPNRETLSPSYKQLVYDEVFDKNGELKKLSIQIVANVKSKIEEMKP